jgi:hypothetical protein
MRSSAVITLAARPAVLFTLVSLAVFHAPAQAQSPPSPDAAPAGSFAGAATPPNIRVDPLLAPLVDEVLQKSPTLRRQWQTIAAAPRLRVFLTSTAILRETPSARARTEVSRFAFGSIRAVVELPSAADITELLPHELEHVLEQLDGLDLAALAQTSSSGVQEIGRGVYETRRARSAGFDALREVYGTVDPAFGVALRGLRRVFRALLRDAPAAADSAISPAAPGPAVHKQ